MATLPLAFATWEKGAASAMLEENIGNVRYIGITYQENAATSSPVWAIYKEWTSSTATTRTEWAKGNYLPTKIWDLRATYFTSAPPSNDVYSTQFNGTTQYISVTNNDLLARLGLEYAVSFWVKGNSFNGTQTLTACMPRWWNIYTTAGGANIRIAAEVRDSLSNLVSIVGTTVLTNGEWYHIAFSRNGNTTRLWIDGVLQGQATGSLSTITNMTSCVVGSDFNVTPSRWLQGRMDDFCVWDTYLTDADVQELYNGGWRLDPKLTSKAANCTLLYYLGDGGDTSTTFMDQSGRGNVGTGVNLTPSSFIADIPNG